MEPQKIGLKLQNLREQRGLSMRDLASQAGVAVSFLSRIEKGKSSPTIMTLQKLLSAMGMEVVEFFQISDVPDPADQIIFKKETMQVLNEADRTWCFAFPPHPSLKIILTYEEYQPHTQVFEIQQHPDDLYGFIISGRLTIEVLGRGVFHAEKGDAFFIRSGMEHISRNDGDTLLKLVVAKRK